VLLATLPFLLPTLPTLPLLLPTLPTLPPQPPPSAHLPLLFRTGLIIIQLID